MDRVFEGKILMSLGSLLGVVSFCYLGSFVVEMGIGLWIGLGMVSLVISNMFIWLFELGIEENKL